MPCKKGEGALSLPKQDGEELVMQLSMYPTEWNLSERDKEELMLLLGLSAVEWEKRAREATERRVEAERVRQRLIASSAAKSEQAPPKTWPLGRLVPAPR